MGKHKIDKPSNFKIKTDDSLEITVSFSDMFSGKYSEMFNKVQSYIDSEVLRYCDPLVPMQTGMLKKSGTLGTELGSGEVKYIAPYAAKQYYETAETRAYDPNRGAYWFERMKPMHRDAILSGAKRVVGSK